jgi:hypothetical protein
MRGGQPSITTPMPPPCDSPNVVTRNSWPKVLPMSGYSSTAVSAVGQAGVSPAGTATQQARTPVLLNRFERALQVIDQIADVLDTDRQPDERIGDTEFLPLFFRHGGMRHERGMIDQAFHAAQALRQ